MSDHEETGEEDGEDAPRPELRARHGVLLGIAVGMAVGLARWHALGADAFGRINWEEVWNAGQARSLDWGPASQTLHLQYRSFCGGCTAEAVLGSVAFRALGGSVGAWKLALVASGAVLVAAVTARLATRISGRAAVAFGLLATFAPAGVVAASLRGWGNHVEAAGLGALALVLGGTGDRRLRGAFVAGLVGGLALWVGLSSAAAVVGAAVAVAMVPDRSPPRAIAAFTGGLVLTAGLPWLVFALAMHASPFSIPVDLLTGASARPRFEPDLLRAVAVPSTAQTWAAELSGLAAAAAALVLVRDRRPVARGAVVALAALGLAYAVIGVGTSGEEVDGAYPLYQVRYLVPAVVLGLVTVSLAVDRLATASRPLLAHGLLVGALASGVVTATAWLAWQPLAPCELHRPAMVATAWRRGALSFRARELRFDCPADDAVCAQLETYRRGVMAGDAVDYQGAVPADAPPSDTYLAGLGLGLVRPSAGPSLADALDPVLHALEPLRAAPERRVVALAEAAAHPALRGRDPDPAWLAALDEADRRALGWGLGSRYPEDRATTAVVDRLDDPALAEGYRAGLADVGNEVRCRGAHRPVPGGPVYRAPEDPPEG
jgi:hypothetical protein